MSAKKKRFKMVILHSKIYKNYSFHCLFQIYIFVTFEIYYFPTFRPDHHQPYFVSRNNVKICVAKVDSFSLNQIL